MGKEHLRMEAHRIPYSQLHCSRSSAINGRHDRRKEDTHDVTSWWYETNAGIEVVVEIIGDKGELIDTEIHKIAWSALRAALARKDRK